MRITIRPVQTKPEIKQFLKLPFSLYHDDVNWVAPLQHERLEHLSRKKNPYFQHADAQLFLAEKEGKIVGRISAQIDRLHLERYDDATGQFGFFEAIDDQEVCHKLFDAAENWLRARGMKRVRGPFNFSINEETGLLIEGFNTPPCIMMGHARPYYQKLIETEGYYKAKDVLAYLFDGKAPLLPPLARSYNRAMSSADITLRHLSKKNLARDLEIINDIHADAWSNNWGYVPFTKAELEKLGQNLKLLVNEEYVTIANYKGKPAAMAVTLPNINDWIKPLHGQLLPFGWARILWHRFAKPPQAVRMPLMGVRKEYHNTLIGSALALAVIETTRRYHVNRGTQYGELSWILEDNMPMRHILEALEATAYKTYRVFEKAL